jgi:hypothetical protein
MTEDDLALGVHSKLLGQIRLVMLGYQRSVDGWRTGEVIHVW